MANFALECTCIFSCGYALFAMVMILFSGLYQSRSGVRDLLFAGDLSRPGDCDGVRLRDLDLRLSYDLDLDLEYDLRPRLLDLLLS